MKRRCSKSSCLNQFKCPQFNIIAYNTVGNVGISLSNHQLYIKYQIYYCNDNIYCYIIIHSFNI